MSDSFMNAAIAQAEKGIAEGGIPIGSVIVHGGRILGGGHNRRVPSGYAIYNVEIQIDKYANGLPPGLNPPVEPLPFLYGSTGVETGFINPLERRHERSRLLPPADEPASALLDRIQAERAISPAEDRTRRRSRRGSVAI